MSCSLRLSPLTAMALWTSGLLANLPSSGSAQQVAQPPATPVALQQLIPAIDAHFRRFQETAHIPGLVYGIVRDGKL
ncbi:MAG: hypothetical protein ACREOG_20340, partial [Gemmatimonadaceae bacterium]